MGMGSLLRLRCGLLYTCIYPHDRLAVFSSGIIFAVNITHLCLRTRYAVIGIVLTALAGFATSRIFWLPYSIQTAMTGTIFVFCGFMLREKNILARLKEAPLFRLSVLFFLRYTSPKAAAGYSW